MASYFNSCLCRSRATFVSLLHSGLRRHTPHPAGLCRHERTTAALEGAELNASLRLRLAPSPFVFNDEDSLTESREATVSAVCCNITIVSLHHVHIDVIQRMKWAFIGVRAWYAALLHQYIGNLWDFIFSTAQLTKITVMTVPKIM